MTMGHVLGNGQPQTDTAMIEITAFVQAFERLEGVFHLVGRNPRAIIINGNLDDILLPRTDNGNFIAILHRIVDQICDTALERIAAHGQNANRPEYPTPLHVRCDGRHRVFLSRYPQY